LPVTLKVILVPIVPLVVNCLPSRVNFFRQTGKP
jgi:hypothetical protein